MDRKLIKQGKGGFTIYLPKKWVDKKGLTESDLIKITDLDSSLLISSSVKEKKEFVLKLNDDNKKDIKNILTHVYRKGFDVVILEKIDNSVLRKVKEVVGDLLLGFEITEKTANSCRLENISEPTAEKYSVLLRRSFLIVKETINSILDGTDLKTVVDLRKQQDKYILFCRRILIKEKYEKDSILEWELLTFLMHIEHGLHYMYKYAVENKIKFDNDLLSLFKEFHSFFDMFYQAYFTRDLKLIHKLNSLKEKLVFDKCFSLIEKSKGKKSVVYSQLREVFRLVQVGTSPVLAELLDECL